MPTHIIIGKLDEETGILKETSSLSIQRSKISKGCYEMIVNFSEAEVRSGFQTEEMLVAKLRDAIKDLKFDLKINTEAPEIIEGTTEEIQAVFEPLPVINDATDLEKELICKPIKQEDDNG